MRGLVVALVGADGAGKSTVARRLPELLDLPVTAVYAGDNPEAGGAVLPTTRLLDRRRRSSGAIEHGPPPVERAARRALVRRLLTAPISVFLLVNQCAEELARLRKAAKLAAAGHVAVLDRSYVHDYWHHDVVGPDRSIRQRIHGWWLTHALPRADLVIVLDAPAEVLFARKPEGSLDALRRRRSEYASLHTLAPTVVVDVTQQLPLVEAAVASAVTGRLASMNRSARRR